jgi:polysaccharide export outer membrane protein
MAFSGATLQAQEESARESARLEVSRARLETIRSELEQQLSSQTLKETERTLRDAQLAAIRLRLQNGDFQPGDQITLSVVGEPDLTATFAVAQGPSIPLPIVGDVPLSGVLASELNDHLTRSIGEVVRNPVVRARALVRLSVLGEVANPGFYLVTPDAPLTEALMLAGGPTREGKIDKIVIEHGSNLGRAPEGSRDVERPLESLSVNDLGLRTGDRIVVPGGAGLSGSLVRYGLIGLTAAVSLLQLLR